MRLTAVLAATYATLAVFVFGSAVALLLAGYVPLFWTALSASALFSGLSTLLVCACCFNKSTGSQPE